LFDHDAFMHHTMHVLPDASVNHASDRFLYHWIEYFQFFYVWLCV